MKLDELILLVKQGESENLEFKKTTGQRTAAAKTACAFLNGHGGYVLFGVLDTGEIPGQEISSKTLEDIAHEFKKIDPQISSEISSVQLGNGNSVIIVAVKKGDGPYTYDGRPYVWQGRPMKGVCLKECTQLIGGKTSPQAKT